MVAVMWWWPSATALAGADSSSSVSVCPRTWRVRGEGRGDADAVEVLKKGLFHGSEVNYGGGVIGGTVGLCLGSFPHAS
jgi:hypothetical protein